MIENVKKIRQIYERAWLSFAYKCTGYVLTDGGIYGGKLTDKSWGCILPKDKMESGYVQNFIKTSGHDAEFYCFQMKDKNEFQWIHYY